MNEQLAQINYEQDFYKWAILNAKLLKESQWSKIDAENIAEELESMGKRDKRQLVNRLIVLLMHLLKWEFQQEKRSRSWKSSIIEQRRRIAQLLEDSPSLYNEINNKMNYIYNAAVEQAVSETGIELNTFPATCPYSIKQILEDDYYPAG